MDHIHNLTIIDIAFHHGDAFVGTNSIHNALYARTCMLSRSTYKGCKIEFFADECDVPLPQRTIAKTPAPPKSVKRQAMPTTNRFNLLNMDGTEDDSAEEDESPADDSSNDADNFKFRPSRSNARLDFLGS